MIKTKLVLSTLLFSTFINSSAIENQDKKNKIVAMLSAKYKAQTPVAISKNLSSKKAYIKILDDGADLGYISKPKDEEEAKKAQEVVMELDSTIKSGSVYVKITHKSGIGNYTITGLAYKFINSNNSKAQNAMQYLKAIKEDRALSSNKFFEHQSGDNILDTLLK